MLASRSILRLVTTHSARFASTIPVNEIASVLKLNVGDETTAVTLDERMKTMSTMMEAHDGFSHATRYVCKAEWAYELSFVFDGPDSFGAWQEGSELKESVHAYYLEALDECGIDEEDVYGGARVHDKW
jgi:hypothetical protein